MTDLGQRYMLLMLQLFEARAAAKDRRLLDEEESRRAEELDDVWRAMDEAEQIEVETTITEDKALALAWKQETEAPLSLANWTACERGAPIKGAYEVNLYSDVWFLGEIKSFGPYRVFNYVRIENDTRIPALALRIESHRQLGMRRAPVNKAGAHETAATQFTGTSLADEIAALLSLTHGARIAAGGEIRRFALGEDPRGEPEIERLPPPSLPPRLSYSGTRIPLALEKKTLTAELLDTYRLVEPGVAVSLVRAARSYRDGLWVAESDPALSWLLFISALETAAVQTAMGVDVPEVVLNSSAPDLVKMLEEASPGLAKTVAPVIAPLFKATSRFIKFVDKFRPLMPTQRPMKFAQFEWTPKNLKAAMSTIYGLRSRALHEATPFPPPMCSPVRLMGGGYEERSMGLASGDSTSWWAKDDLPMNLHLFEYITRSVLLNWWRSLVPTTPNDASSSAAAPRPGVETTEKDEPGA